MKFVNFDLSIEPRTGDGYPVLADNPTYGQGRGLCKLDPASADMQSKLDTIAREEMDSAGLTAFGKALGASLFNGTVEDVFARTLGGVQAEAKSGVRVRLRVNAPELNILPWEFMQLENGADPLATALQTSLSRYIELSEVVHKVEAPAPLRMLGIIPQGAGLDTDKEKAALDRAVAELGSTVQLSWLEGKVTRDSIRDALGANNVHIVHFIGHGYMDGTRASLRLNDDYGDDYPVQAETFAGFFRDSSVRLVVLNACRGAARSATDAALGVAPQVVRRGVPAVVAMQWDINDRVAQSFAKTFYRTLCVGPEAGLVDAAVARGRSVLYDDWPGNRAFATPVLFLRAEDGRLWKDSEPDPDKAAAAHTVVQNIGVQVAGGNISGDVTGGNKIVAGDNSNIIIAAEGATVIQPAPAAGGSAVVTLLNQARTWQSELNTVTDGLPLSDDDKADLKDQAAKIKTELTKNVRLDPVRLGRLINALGALGGEDLVAVTVARLAQPLQGIGFELTKDQDSKVTLRKSG